MTTRALALLFALALKVTAPVPVPLEAPVNESPPASDLADHAQPDVVVTITELVSPPPPSTG